MWTPPAHSPLRLGHVLRGLTAGPQSVTRFEIYLAERFEADAAIFTQSGTQALQLAIGLALSTRSEEEGAVGLPAFSCFDLVSAVVGARAQTRFYDVERKHLGPDMDSLAAIQADLGAVVVANLYGYPIDWQHTRDVVGNTILIEDAAQGLGSTFNDQAAGTFGDLTVLSFGRGKGWTGGGGGALLIRDRARFPNVTLPPDAPAARIVTTCKSTAQYALGRPGWYSIPSSLPGLALGDTIYHPPVPPRRGSAVTAATALASADLAQAAATVRRNHAETLIEGIEQAGLDVTFPTPVGGGVSSYLRLPAFLTSTLDGASGLGSMGVVRSYPCALPALPEARSLTTQTTSEFPASERLASRLFTLPTHAMTNPTRLISRLATGR